MGLFGSAGRNYEAAQVSEGDVERLAAAVEVERGGESELLQARPAKENDGITAGVGLLKNLHDVRLDRAAGVTRNVSHTYGHELWHEDGKIQFVWRAPNETTALDLTDKIENRYDADVSPTQRVFPTVEPEDYVAGATVHLTDSFWKPIKSPLTEKGDEDPITDEDPYGDITTDMEFTPRSGPDGDRITADECRVLVQTMFSPARDVWSRGGAWGENVKDKARGRTKPSYSASWLGAVREKEPTRDDRKAADILQRQYGEKGYYVTMRVFVVSPYRQVAEDYARTVAGDYRRYYESFTQQGLAPEPIAPGGMVDVLTDAVTRRHRVSTRDRLAVGGKCLLNVYGLAAVAHLPNEEINSPAVDWYEMETGPGVPPDAAQMEDVTPQDDTTTDRARAFDPEQTDDVPDPVEAVQGLGDGTGMDADADDAEAEADDDDDDEGAAMQW